MGDSHRVPEQPGLLAQLDVVLENGKTQVMATDGSWRTALASAWLPNTPKVSIQMEPAEWYDARVLNGKTARAKVVADATAGPWQDLQPRDVRLLTRKPFPFRSFLSAKVVKSEGTDFCLPAARLVNPGVLEANNNASLACGMATILDLPEPRKLNVREQGFKYSIGGKPPGSELPAGRHLVLVFARDVTSHAKEKSIRFAETDLKFVNPVDEKHPNPWVFLRFPEAQFATNDILWSQYIRENKEVSGKIDWFNKRSDEYLRTVKDASSFKAALGSRAELMPADQMFVKDSVWWTWERSVMGDAAAFVQSPTALMHPNPEVTTVSSGANGDIELLYDLGEQSCGYYEFDLTADAGVVVDLVGVEYISPDGRIQWSHGNRNGMRYITKAGRNQFVSVKRRSQRYVFATLRNIKSPVNIRYLGLIESTYPVDAIGMFASSDPRLDDIWSISARTLKLCMEDTLTDCPLYEQTHWVGDARNESLYAYSVFGATDIGKRCAKQTAQSLERYPIVGAQVPSGWDCLLPAWSFLWTVSTWDYYWETGEKAFLQEIHPAVVGNLKGAEKFIDERDLFSAPFWNFFDWTPIDQNQRTVLHNSLLLIGAIDAAQRSEKALGCNEHTAWLQGLRDRLTTGVKKLWDPGKGAYPDAIRDDGSISKSTSQHTSFLSVLYDAIERDNVDAAKRNLLNPPDGMVRIGSPFASQYLFEALEKLGLENEIVNLIYKNYVPMLEAGATTVWESFPSGTTGSGGFPTRSHCHAWASAPLYFLNRIAVGVKPAAVGWQEAVISPHPGELTWAHGVTATPKGPISVSWKLTGENMEIKATAPEGVRLRFESNPHLKGKTVTLNGKPVNF